MTKHSEKSVTNLGDEAYTVWFVLGSPATGNKTLAASWTTARDMYMSCASFTGTDTTNVVNAAHDTTGTSAASLAVTSTTDGATLVCAANNTNLTGTNFTTIFTATDKSPDAGASYTLGGTSNTHTFTGTGGSAQASSGIHIIAAAAGAAEELRLMMLGVGA